MSTFLSRRRLVQATGAALASAALPALAQTSWPSRPIRPPIRPPIRRPVRRTAEGRYGRRGSP